MAEVLYHLYDTTTQTILKRSVPWPRADGGPVHGLASNLVYLELMAPPELPAFDPVSQVAVPTETVELASGRVLRGWEVQTRPVPDFVTSRQLQLWLHSQGLLAAVEAALNAMEEPGRTAAIIEWRQAREYRRDHPLVAALGAALSLDSAAVDAAFREASVL